MPHSETGTWPCPSPDDCEFVADRAVKLAEHVNTEHAGEFQRPDWPETEAARQRREPTTSENGDDDVADA